MRLHVFATDDGILLADLRLFPWSNTAFVLGAMNEQDP